MNIQSKIFNTTFKGINQTLLFPPPIFLNLPIFPQMNNFPKYKAINEPEENKENKFYLKREEERIKILIQIIPKYHKKRKFITNLVMIMLKDD